MLMMRTVERLMGAGLSIGFTIAASRSPSRMRGRRDGTQSSNGTIASIASLARRSGEEGGGGWASFRMKERRR